MKVDWNKENRKKLMLDSEEDSDHTEFFKSTMMKAKSAMQSLNNDSQMQPTLGVGPTQVLPGNRANSKISSDVKSNNIDQKLEGILGGLS